MEAPPPVSGQLVGFLDTVLANAPSGNPAWCAAFAEKTSLSYTAPELLDAAWTKVYTNVLLAHVASHDTEAWTFPIHAQWSALMLARFSAEETTAGVATAVG